MRSYPDVFIFVLFSSCRDCSDDADVFTVRLNGDGADVTPLSLFFEFSFSDALFLAETATLDRERPGDGQQRFVVPEPPVRVDDFSYASVVYPETQDADPVFLSLAFFRFAALCAVSLDRCAVFHSGDQIVVAAYIRVDLSARHPDIFCDMGVRTCERRQSVFFGEDLGSAVGGPGFTCVESFDEVELLYQPHIHVLESHRARACNAEWVCRTKDAAENMNDLDQLATAHAAYLENRQVYVIGHDDEYVTCILCIVFDPPDNAEVPVAGIFPNGIPGFAAFIAVVIGDHETVVSKRHEFVNEFTYGNSRIKRTFFCVTM
ncbi:MAG: hypothetical protein V8R14_07845 [Clostridia bacterium]